MCVPLAGSNDFHFMTCISTWALQLVSTLYWPALFPYLDLFLCSGLQVVSVPRCLAFNRCPDSPHHPGSPGREYRLLACIFFHVLICLSISAPQLVSAPRWVAFIPCYDLSPFGLSSWSVSLSGSHSLYILTGIFVWALQEVSVPLCPVFFSCPDLSLCPGSTVRESPRWLAFFLCPDLSLYLGSPACECPLLA